MENYIVINGKKAELTEEQLKKLGIEVKSNNPFEPVFRSEYGYINEWGKVCCEIDMKSYSDFKRRRSANYCRDENLLCQRALHEALDRLLWRFSCENGELENPWDGKHIHWVIAYDTTEKKFFSVYTGHFKSNEPYFPSKEIAQRAIDEIVKPFMEKHPDFVW